MDRWRWALVLTNAVLAGCITMPPAGTLIAVQTQTPAPIIDLGPSGCPAALLEGVLVADDDFGFVVEQADGLVSSVVWPHGYVARDADPRELLDGSGRVVARAGDYFSAGGGWLGQSDADGFTPCGRIEITAAGGS